MLETIVDPPGNWTRVLEMDESDMQYEVERPFPYSPQAGLFFSMTHEEKIDSDRRSICVGNVDYGATADELEMYFNGCGHVNRITIPYNRFTVHPKGKPIHIKLSVTTDGYLHGGWSRGRDFRASRFYNPFRGCHFISSVLPIHNSTSHDMEL
uniref:RRM domain-containing protein n=1 Tax=Cyprinus carpio TaxID=7962 RepID=A0A8C1YBM5_CYPCA